VSRAKPPHADTADIADITAPGRARKAAPMLSPRLLDVHRAAIYLGVSSWTVRDWAAAGYIVPVALPPLRPREGDRRRVRLRRLLFDRQALDKFVDGLRAARD